MRSVTSSFRISRELQERLNSAAARQGRGKNAILTEALTTYLTTLELQDLAKEGRRQSEAVSRDESGDDWYHIADVSAWR